MPADHDELLCGSEDRYLPLEEGETEWLMHARPGMVEIAFGPGGTALKWAAGTPIPDDWRLVLERRRVLATG